MLSPKEEIVNQLEKQLQSSEFERHYSTCNSLIEQYLQLDLEEKVNSGFIEDVDDEAEKNRQEEGDHDGDQDAVKTEKSATEPEESESPEPEETADEPSDPVHERMMN